MNHPDLQFAGSTNSGLVRLENEDNWKACPEQGLFIVADGMGGQQAGALASRVVVEVLPRLLENAVPNSSHIPKRQAKKAFTKALAKLSSELYSKAHDDAALAGMGSTVVAVAIQEDAAIVAHLGDSRAYLLRGGRLRRLTKDHCLAQLLLDSGEITPEEARDHPARNHLTRFVGMRGEPLPDVRWVSLKPDDRLLLCTDGLTKEVTDDRIRAILEQHREPASACTELVAATRQAGAHDNVTVIVLSFHAIPALLGSE